MGQVRPGPHRRRILGLWPFDRLPALRLTAVSAIVCRKGSARPLEFLECWSAGVLEWGRKTIPFSQVTTSAKRRWERISAIWERILGVSAGHSPATALPAGSRSGPAPPVAPSGRLPLADVLVDGVHQDRD